VFAPEAAVFAVRNTGFANQSSIYDARDGYPELVSDRFGDPAVKIGYARVSTKDQAVDLRVDAPKQAGCAKAYREVISGARAHRLVLEGLLETLRPGDGLMIWKLGRLGRSLPP